MTTPRPSVPRAAFMDTKLHDLPGLRFFARAYRSLLLANATVRRQAKALLYRELGAALRRGVPLVDALRLASEEPEVDPVKTAMPLFRGTRFFLSIAAFLFMPVTLFVLLVVSLFFAPRWHGTERVARMLAGILHRRVEEGSSLSDAMRSLSGDFDPEEVAIVVAGERSGNESLIFANLAALHDDRERLTMLASPLLAPLVSFIVGIPVLAFLKARVIPKYADIFEQMGVELPYLTTLFARAWDGRGIVGPMLIFLTAAVIATALLRANMTGSRLGRMLAIFMALCVCTQAVQLSLFSAFRKAVAGGMFVKASLESAMPFLLYIPAIFAALLIAPFFLRLLELGFLRAERFVLTIIGALPVVGGPSRLLRQSRWLQIVSGALRCGMPTAEAFRLAGETGGWRLGSRSQAAAALVEMGHSLSDSIRRTRAIDDIYAHRLALIEDSRDVPEATSLLAVEMQEQALLEGRAIARIASVVLTILACVLFATFVNSMYLPLFALPNLVR